MAKKVIPGVDDLFTLNPTAEKMWDFEKNVVDPMTLTLRSAASVWWRCDKGHSFKRSVSAFYLNTNCPECKKESQSILNYPHIMRFWDFDKNPEDPAITNRNYSKPVHWKCPDCGYEWTSLVKSRTDKCPICGVDRPGRIVTGKNDVATLAPVLLGEFIEEKNPGISLTTIGISDKKTKIWWKCRKCGYEWNSTVFSRLRGCDSNETNKCPVCGKAKRSSSFGEQYPELEDSWSPSNGFLLSSITGNDWHNDFIWRCPIHGDFTCSLSSRIRAINSETHGCPYCLSRKTKSDESIAVTYPDLMNEWSFAENSLLCDPKKVSPTKSLTVWWICAKCGKKYTRKICERVKDRDRGLDSCPSCSKATIQSRIHII